MTPKKSAPKLPAYLQCQDPSALGALLVEAHGTIAAAARKARLTREVVGRQCRGPGPKGVSQPYWKRLRDSLPDDPADLRESFDRLFFTPGTLGLLENYRAWLADELRPIGGDRWTNLDALLNARPSIQPAPELRPYFGLLGPFSGVTRQTPAGAADHLLAEFQETVVQVRRIAPAEWQKFDKALATRGVDIGRRVLAVYRLMEPLLPYARGGQPRMLELDWQALGDAGRLAGYLRSALSRELHLVRWKEPAAVMAQLLAAPVGTGEALSLDSRRREWRRQR